MRKSILTLGIAAVLTGVLATCSMAYAADDELAQIQESGKLKVGVEGTYPPYTYHDDNGELTGGGDAEAHCTWNVLCSFYQLHHRSDISGDPGSGSGFDFYRN